MTFNIGIVTEVFSYFNTSQNNEYLFLWQQISIFVSSIFWPLSLLYHSLPIPLSPLIHTHQDWKDAFSSRVHFLANFPNNVFALWPKETRVVFFFRSNFLSFTSTGLLLRLICFRRIDLFSVSQFSSFVCYVCLRIWIFNIISKLSLCHCLFPATGTAQVQARIFFDFNSYCLHPIVFLNIICIFEWHKVCLSPKSLIFSIILNCHYLLSDKK